MNSSADELEDLLDASLVKRVICRWLRAYTHTRGDREWRATSDARQHDTIRITGFLTIEGIALLRVGAARRKDEGH